MGNVYKLNRLWNIGNPRMMLAHLLFFAFVLLFVHLPTGGQIEAHSELIIPVAIVWVYFEWQTFSGCPKTLTVLDRNLIFTVKAQRPFGFTVGPFRIGRAHGLPRLKAQCHVSNIDDLTFRQSVVEKWFDVGHIVFTGKATVKAKQNADRIPLPDRFRIYGIRHFSEFSDYLKATIGEP